MNFREAYEDDLEQAFFDPEEFAEEHTIDGKKVLAVVMDAGLTQANDRRQGAFNPKDMSINTDSKTVYLMEKNCERKFAPNTPINIDGKRMIVIKTGKLHGIVRLTVRKNAV